MKEKIKIITDTTTSLSPEECKKLDLDYVETTYVVDGEEHSAYDNESETLPMFYEKLDNIKSCSTGCVNVQAFEDVFTKWINQGYKVIYTGLSAALSSTYQNAKIAADKINNEHGKKLVVTIDSRSASYGTLCLIDEIKELIEKEKSIEEIEKLVDAMAHNMSVAFVCRDLSFLHKSGRISLLSAGLGKLLHVVPIVYVSKEDAKLRVGDKCLGSKLAFKTLKNRFINFIKEKKHKRCYITSCNLPNEVEELKKAIIENTDIKEVKTGLIDKTLACCCGPKTIAIFCG